jgi:hypothetical protein
MRGVLAQGGPLEVDHLSEKAISASSLMAQIPRRQHTRRARRLPPLRRRMHTETKRVRRAYRIVLLSRRGSRAVFLGARCGTLHAVAAPCGGFIRKPGAAVCMAARTTWVQWTQRCPSGLGTGHCAPDGRMQLVQIATIELIG